MKLIRLGEMDGGMTDRLMALEGLWQAAVSTPCLSRHPQLIWGFVCNVIPAHLHRLCRHYRRAHGNDLRRQLALARARRHINAASPKG